MRKLIKRLVISIMSVVLLTAFGGTMKASASEIAPDAEVLFVNGYEVSNETITPGNEFTLTVHIHNYSASVTAPVAHVVVINPPGVIPEYGTISEAIIEEVRPGEDTSVTFKYNAEATIDSNYLDFSVNIVSETINNTTGLRIPVGRTTDFSAENISVPKTYGVDQSEYISAKVTNLGMTGVSNVVMVARADGEDIASTRIGTMVAGTNKTETLNITFADQGEYLLELVLTYTNNDGEDKEYMITSTTVTVGTEAESTIPQENIVNDSMDDETEDTQNGIGIDTVVLICVCGFLLIAVCCVVLILIYRRK